MTLPPNQLSLLPKEVSAKPAAGIGIELWTETSVSGDSSKLHGVTKSDASRIWLELENQTPVFNRPSEVLKLDEESFGGPGQVLYSLRDLFQDQDVDEALEWRVEVPRALQDYVVFDRVNSKIGLAEGVSDLSDLPAGLFRLVVSAKDSSGAIGDRSGMTNGSLQLLIANTTETQSSRVNGLNLLATLDPSDQSTINAIKEALGKDSDAPSPEVKAMVEILAELGIGADDVEESVSNLSNGSVEVLGGEDQPLVLLDASRSESVLLDPTQQEATEEMLSSVGTLFQVAGGVQADLGVLDFGLDTQGRDFGVLQIELQDGVEVESLVKTTSDGTPFVFRSELKTYEGNLSLDDWLKSLPYGIYDYGAEGYLTDGDPILLLQAGNDSLAGELEQENLSLFDFAGDSTYLIDGSAYLIDLDADGVADMISMLLLDQGWFDTRSEIGVIGDPLIPVRFLPPASPRTSFQAFGDPGPSVVVIPSQSPVAPIVPSDSADVVPSDSAEVVPSDSAEVVPSDSAPPVEPGFTGAEGGRKQEEPSRAPEAGFSSIEPGKVPGVSVDSSNKATPIDLSLHQPETMPKPLIRDQMVGLGGSVRAVEVPLPESAVDSQESSAVGTSQPAQTPLASVQNWLQARKRNAADLLDSLLEPILQQPGEASMTAVLAMLVGPVLTERIGTVTSKSIRQAPRLQLMRRDPHFQGRWLMPRRDGRLQLIERDAAGCRLHQQQPPLLDQPDLTMLPGFDQQGRSLLSQALPLCRQPGLLVKNLHHLLHCLQHSPDPDLHWQAWLEASFRFESGPAQARAALEQLQQLLQRAMRQDPALADVVMLSQLQDCCEQLGLSGLRARRPSRSHPHRPHSVPIDSAL